MKKLFFLLGGLCCLFPLYAVDLTIKGGAGSMAFNQNRTAPLGSGNFVPNYFPLALVQLEGEHSPFINYRITVERDPVLRNRLSAAIAFNFDYIHLEVGPFAGFLNNWDRVLTPGIAVGLMAEWPGVLFGRLRAGSTIGAGLNGEGDHIQELGEIALGFWVPHVVNTLSVSLRSFHEEKGGGLRIEDQWIRYIYGADIFSKNVPYTVHVDMGFQTLKRSYDPGGSDTLKSVFLGFETTVRINPMVKVLAGAELPLYSWGENPLGNPGRTVLFRAHAGLILNFPKKAPIKSN